MLNGDSADEMIIERSWVVSDDCNNSRTKKQIITAIDTAAPQITCPPNVTITCEGSTSPDSTGYADATDNCADTVTNITHSDVTVPGPCTGDYNINRTWTAVDSCGNVSTCVQVINVDPVPVSYTHLRAHETVLDLVCRLLLEKKNKQNTTHLLHI